jgi:CheY-like chemotaxis protein
MDQIDQRIRDAAIALPKWLANPRNVQAPYLSALYRSIRAVAASARLAGRIPQGQLAGTLEVLLQEIKRMPDKITPSVLCTVAESVGLLPRLHGTSDEAAGPAVQSPLIAVVDDDENARAVLAVALEKAHLRAVCLATSAAALQVFEWNRVDLAILDLEMPGMDGAELAARMRSVPHNAATPVLFVSGRPDLEACATRSGSVSTHFIPKPFIGIELAVKALSILHARGSDAVLTLKRPLEERVA